MLQPTDLRGVSAVWLATTLLPPAIVCGAVAAVITSETSTDEINGAGGWIGAVTLMVLAAFALLRFTGAAFMRWVLRRRWAHVDERSAQLYGLDFRELWPVLERALDEQSTVQLRQHASRCASSVGSSLGFLLAYLLSGSLISLAYPVPGVVWVAPAASALLALTQLYAGRRDAARYADTVAVLLNVHRLDVLRELRLPAPIDSREEAERVKDAAALVRGDTDRLVVYDTGRGGADGTHLPPPEAPKINYAGYVEAWVQTPDGSRTKTLRPGGEYRLALRFTEKKPEGIDVRAVEVTGGRDASTVPFTIALDSSTIGFPPTDQDVSVPHGDTTLTYPVDAPAAAGNHRVWIQVLQHNRVLQVLPLQVAVAETAAR